MVSSAFCSLGWRVTFYLVSVLTAVLMISMALVLPRNSHPAKIGFLRQFRLFFDRRIQLGVLDVVCGAAASYVFYTYLSPIMRDEIGVPEQYLSIGLVIYGCACLWSNLYGIPSLPDQAFDEHFTMRIAHFLGLRVAETEFRFFDGEPAIVSTRFDRIQNADGTVRALHQIDFTQALGVGADQKYEEHGGPRSEAYAEMLRAHDIHHEADSNVRIFADGMLASYLLGATDSHAKNYSLMLQDSHVAMAPIYDFASVFPYLASGTQRYASTLAMTIGGQRKLLQLRWRSHSHGR